MMYDPHVFTLNLEQILSGVPLDTAIGVLQVTVCSARDMKGPGPGIGTGALDPYVSLTLNNRAELARTKHMHNTSVAVKCLIPLCADSLPVTTPPGWKPNSSSSILSRSPSF